MLKHSLCICAFDSGSVFVGNCELCSVSSLLICLCSSLKFNPASADMDQCSENLYMKATLTSEYRSEDSSNPNVACACVINELSTNMKASVIRFILFCLQSYGASSGRSLNHQKDSSFVSLFDEDSSFFIVI